MGKVCQTQKNVLIKKTKPKSNVIHTKRDIELCVCVCVMMSEPVSISLHESSSKSKEEEIVLKKLQL